uniref:ANK_REP_REGION domain-containing protein n=1 Tax=Macrostomum lignano TaxID=282301 RepID=A0A1I8HDT2_9PLAT
NQSLKDQCCRRFANAAADSQDLHVRNFFVELSSDEELKQQFSMEAAGTATSNQEKQVAEKALLETLELLSKEAAEPEVREQCSDVLAQHEADQRLSVAVAARHIGAKGYAQLVEALLNKLENESEKRALCMISAESAARNGHFELVKSVLHGCKSTRFKYECSIKVAEVASSYGHFEVAKHAIEAIKDQKLRDKCCLKAVKASAKNRQLLITKFLVDSVAENLKDQCCSRATPPAAKNGHLEVVTYLVQEMVDKTLKDQCCSRATPPAAKNGHLEVVTYLVQEMVDKTLKDQCCSRATPPAAKNGHLELVTYLVQEMVDKTVKNQCCKKSAKSASDSQKWDVVKFLAESISNQGQKDECYASAAESAAWSGNLEKTKDFVNSINDSSIKNQSYLRSVESAANNLKLESAEEPSVRLECCMKAAESSQSGGKTDVFDAMSKEVDDLKDEGLKDLYYSRAAESAARCGKADAMMSSLRKIRDTEQRTECHRQCALAGASFGHENVVERFDIEPQWLQFPPLLQFFSMMALKNENSILNKTLSTIQPAEKLRLLRSISREHVSLAFAILRQLTRDVLDLPDSKGATALMLAADAGHHELIEKLVELGASVQVQDSHGRTALTRACEAGHVRAAKSLIDNGADASHQDDRGLTCVQLAEQNGHSELLRLLDSFYLRNENRAQDEPLSTELHELFNSAGFTRDRAKCQKVMADCLQRIPIEVVRDDSWLVRDDSWLTGSYAEGWANSLVQVNGRTADDSDIDWTVVVALQKFHLQGGCSQTGDCAQADQQMVAEGHVNIPESCGSQPALSTPASGVRPRLDLCRAFQCCSDFCTDPERVKLITKPPKVHLVRATRPTKLTQNELRVSFSLHEKQIMRSLSDVQGQLFTVIKFIFKKYLPVTLKTPGLKTYHAKTLLFFMLEKHGTEDFYPAWQPEKLISLVKEALEMMLSFIDSSSSPDECMPHFFMSDAPLYFKNAGIGGDFACTKTRVRDRLIEVRRNIGEMASLLKEYLRPLQSQNFFFHPFALLPLASPSRVSEVRPRRKNQYLHFGDAYCVIYQCLQKLTSAKTGKASLMNEQKLTSAKTGKASLMNEQKLTSAKTGKASLMNEQKLTSAKTGKASLMNELQLLDRLQWCKTAALCLNVMAHLKFGEVEEAEAPLKKLYNHSAQPAWTPECFTTSRLEDWEVPDDLDWAWRFCFPCDTRPRFPFLPEFTQTLFIARLSQPRSSHLYVNFRCLSWSLQAELLRDRTPENEISFDAWKTQLQEDPDLEELLTLAHYSDFREHVDLSLQQMEMIEKERRVAMESQDEEMISWVRQKRWRVSNCSGSDFGAHRSREDEERRLWARARLRRDGADLGRLVVMETALKRSLTLPFV